MQTKATTQHLLVVLPSTLVFFAYNDAVWLVFSLMMESCIFVSLFSLFCNNISVSYRIYKGINDS